MMRRTEEKHHTAEQVREYLVEALAIVAELAPADDLRAAVFTQAATLLAGKQIYAEQPSPLGIVDGRIVGR